MAHRERKPVIRAYSRYSKNGVLLLGRLIRSARTERRMTAAEVAERAGISRGLLQRIEKGDLKCEIGAAFEVAALMGVKVFDMDATAMDARLREINDKLALLPKSVRKAAADVDDDF